MINRLPSDTASFRELADDLGLSTSDTPRIARALGVSESTVWRWWKTGAPKTARLALWWLSREGHSAWDCEMHNRNQLALQLASSLYPDLRWLRNMVARSTDLRAIGETYGPPANEPSVAHDRCLEAIQQSGSTYGATGTTRPLGDTQTGSPFTAPAVDPAGQARFVRTASRMRSI